MGHRHTPEECRSQSAVCGANDGFAAAAARPAKCEGVNDQVLLSLPVRAALFALRFYKAYLSILFAGSCRFEPTCSRYAYEAIERFGVLRGSWLGLNRLLRCHPLSRKFGYDPVPEKLETMPMEMTADDTAASRSAAIPNEVHS
jgi:hypothetical protein